MKQEKNDKVSFYISQTAIVLIIAMVFTGLSIQIARFHSHSSGGGRMRGSKIPVQELWLKMGGGRIREGGVFARGGVIAGFYGNCVLRYVVCLEGKVHAALTFLWHLIFAGLAKAPQNITLQALIYTIHHKNCNAYG